MRGPVISDPERLTLGRMRHPVRGVLNGAAALAAVVGAWLLWSRGSADVPRQTALLIFGLSLAGLFLVSGLYHSVPWRPVWKRRMQRLDHAMIYVLIAGTFTPVVFIVLDGWLRWVSLAVAWGIALVGIGQKILLPRLGNGFSITLQTAQGWLALLLFVPLARRLPPAALALMVAGGLLYTIGMVLLVIRRPRLWPRVFSYHEVFHLFVVAGGAAHYLLAYRYVAAFIAG